MLLDRIAAGPVCQCILGMAFIEGVLSSRGILSVWGETRRLISALDDTHLLSSSLHPIRRAIGGIRVIIRSGIRICSGPTRGRGKRDS